MSSIIFLVSTTVGIGIKKRIKKLCNKNIRDGSHQNAIPPAACLIEIQMPILCLIPLPIIIIIYIPVISMYD